MTLGWGIDIVHFLLDTQIITVEYTQLCFLKSCPMTCTFCRLYSMLWWCCRTLDESVIRVKWHSFLLPAVDSGSTVCPDQLIVPFLVSLSHSRVPSTKLLCKYGCHFTLMMLVICFCFLYQLCAGLQKKAATLQHPPYCVIWLFCLPDQYKELGIILLCF